MIQSITFHLALIGFTALAASALVIWITLASGMAFKILDKPNSRSLHANPTPRLGGICLVVAAICVAVVADISDLLPALAAAGFLAIVSLCDDIWSLPALARFGSHIAAAIFVVAMYPLAQLWLLPCAVIYIAWLTNLFNFMDGMDGFSGGMAVVGFGAFAVAALQTGAMALGVLSVSITGAALGFLIFNFPPARIFMGDAGSIPLGFLAASLGYLGYRTGAWPWWFGPFVFSPFIVDASITLLLRIVAREKVWEAHRSHYYQRMAQSGFGHLGTTLRWYVLMIGVACSALYFRSRPEWEIAAMLASWIVIYVAAIRWIDRLWPRQKFIT